MWASVIDLQHYVSLWFAAFLFTQAVEIPVYIVGLRASAVGAWPWWKRALVGFGASLLTHPAVWFIVPFAFVPTVGFGRDTLVTLGPIEVTPYLLMMIIAELFAWLAEALYLSLLGARRALGWALAANALSFGLGLVSRDFLGWP